MTAVTLDDDVQQSRLTLDAMSRVARHHPMTQQPPLDTRRHKQCSDGCGVLSELRASVLGQLKAQALTAGTPVKISLPSQSANQ